MSAVASGMSPRWVLTIGLTLFMAACGTIDSSTNRAAADHHTAASPSATIGMTEEAFLALMAPALQPDAEVKRTDQYTRGGKTFKVYYPRSAVIADGALTDDEVTPYFFLDSLLVAVGWDFMGGPRYTSRDVQEEKDALRRHHINKGNDALLSNPNNQINCGTTGGTNPFC